jgi:excisionase family DNA binding protein
LCEYRVRTVLRANLGEEVKMEVSAGENQLLTIGELSEYLKVHPCTIRIWVKEGRIKAYGKGESYDLRRARYCVLWSEMGIVSPTIDL